MTKGKLELKIGELVRKHGDIQLIVYEDRKTGAAVGGWTLSTVPVNNTADLKEVERILKEGAPRHIKI